MRIKNACLLSSLLFVSPFSFAELKELDEKELEDLTGKEGVSIDMSFKWKIGEIYFDLNGSQDKNAPRVQASVQPRPVSLIHYELPD